MKMIEFDIDKIRNSLSNTNIKLDIYRSIMNSFHNTNVSTDLQFQHNYKVFYGMYRYADTDFCRVYFEYMENNKTSGIDFEDIIKFLYREIGTMQPSFSSKLLHTINPNKPILDSRVEYHLKLKTIQSQNHIPKIFKYYDELVLLYDEYMKTQNAADVISGLMKYLETRN